MVVFLYPFLTMTFLVLGCLAMLVPAVLGDDKFGTFADWATVGGSLFAAAGLFSAAEQNVEQRRWKSKEFVAGFMRDYLAQPEVRNVIRMLDWDLRRINLVDGPDTLVTHKWDRHNVTPADLKKKLEENDIVVLELAWVPNEERNGDDDERSADSKALEMHRFSAAEAEVRDELDLFLDGLEQIATFMSAGLIPKGDLNPYLDYHLNKMRTGDLNAVLKAYVKKYNYVELQKLL